MFLSLFLEQDISPREREAFQLQEWRKLLAGAHTVLGKTYIIKIKRRGPYVQVNLSVHKRRKVMNLFNRENRIKTKS